MSAPTGPCGRSTFSKSKIGNDEVFFGGALNGEYDDITAASQFSIAAMASGLFAMASAREGGVRTYVAARLSG